MFGRPLHGRKLGGRPLGGWGRSHHNVPSGGVGGFSAAQLDAFMAAQAARLYVDFTDTATTWQDTSATTPADDVGEAIGRVDDAITLTSSPNNATQATGTLKGVRQTAGCKYDGTDDSHLTTYTAGSGANFIVALVTVPASISATQIFCGAQESSANRFRAAFTSSGRFAASVGDQQEGTIFCVTDRRGTEVVVGLSVDGSTVRLFDDAAIGYEAAQSGVPTTTIPFRLGALNNNGTANSYFAGSIKKLVAGREFLTLSRYRQIRNGLLAA